MAYSYIKRVLRKEKKNYKEQRVQRRISTIHNLMNAHITQKLIRYQDCWLNVKLAR